MSGGISPERGLRASAGRRTPVRDGGFGILDGRALLDVADSGWRDARFVVDADEERAAVGGVDAHLPPGGDAQ
jgi:hypothetical protein